MPVLGEICPNDGFVNSVARYLRERAELAGRAIGTPMDSPSTPRHVAALEELADYLLGLPPDDQRVFNLYQLHGDKYEPKGETESRLLTTIGSTGTHVPAPREVLDELVRAAVVDDQASQRAISQKVQELRAQVERLDALRPELEEAREKLERTEAELSEAQSEAGRLRGERNYLRTLVPSEPTTPTEPAGVNSSGDSGGLDGGGKSKPKRPQKPKEPANA